MVLSHIMLHYLPKSGITLGPNGLRVDVAKITLAPIGLQHASVRVVAVVLPVCMHTYVSISFSTGCGAGWCNASRPRLPTQC